MGERAREGRGFLRLGMPLREKKASFSVRSSMLEWARLVQQSVTGLRRDQKPPTGDLLKIAIYKGVCGSCCGSKIKKAGTRSPGNLKGSIRCQIERVREVPWGKEEGACQSKLRGGRKIVGKAIPDATSAGTLLKGGLIRG